MCAYVFMQAWHMVYKYDIAIVTDVAKTMVYMTHQVTTCHIDHHKHSNEMPIIISTMQLCKKTARKSTFIKMETHRGPFRMFDAFITMTS